MRSIGFAAWLERRIDIAFVDQGARRRWIGAQRRLDIFHIGKRRHLLPGQLELRRRLDRVFLALGDDADEIGDPHYRDEAGNVAHGGFIDINQTCADKIAAIDAGIGRAHHAAMKHAGHADVMDVDEFAGRLGRKVDARHRLADDAIGIGGFDFDVIGEFEADDVVADQFAVADAAVMSADQPVFDRKLLERQLEPFRGARDQKLPGLRGGLAQRHRRNLDGFARNRRALIGNARGIAEYHDDARERHIEFFGDDLPKRGADPRAEIDVAVEGGDRPVRGDLDEGLERTVGAGCDRAHHRQCSLPMFVVITRAGCAHRSLASTALPAARITARMISTCAPQRQRL